MEKKGELEINWIIIAAIALVVLVVVLMIVYGATGKFGDTIGGFWKDILKMWPKWS